MKKLNLACLLLITWAAIATVPSELQAESQIFQATEDIEAGEIVVLDPSQDQSVKLSSTVSDTDVLGVARDDIASGAWGHIVRSNYAICKVYAGTTRGEFVYNSATDGIGANNSTPITGVFARVISPRGSYQYHPSLPLITDACEVMVGPPTELGIGGAGGAPVGAQYITQVPDGTLSAEQALSLLTNGILKHTGGVVARAVPGTDYDDAGKDGNNYIEVPVMVGSADTNLGYMYIYSRVAYGSNPSYVAVERYNGHLSLNNQSSNYTMAVQLPSDYSSMYAGTNIFVDTYCNDHTNNDLRIYVYNEAGTLDAGLGSYWDIDPAGSGSWNQDTEQLTGTYSAGDWIIVRWYTDLDMDDYARIKCLYIRYTKS